MGNRGMFGRNGLLKLRIEAERKIKTAIALTTILKYTIRFLKLLGDKIQNMDKTINKKVFSIHGLVPC